MTNFDSHKSWFDFCHSIIELDTHTSYILSDMGIWKLIKQETLAYCMSHKSGPCFHSEYAMKAGQDFLDLHHYNITTSVSCLKLASTANSKHIFTGQKKSEETCEIEILTLLLLEYLFNIY